jgi:hypothetical protein
MHSAYLNGFNINHKNAPLWLSENIIELNTIEEIENQNCSLFFENRHILEQSRSLKFLAIHKLVRFELLCKTVFPFQKLRV